MHADQPKTLNRTQSTNGTQTCQWGRQPMPNPQSEAQRRTRQSYSDCSAPRVHTGELWGELTAATIAKKLGSTRSLFRLYPVPDRDLLNVARVCWVLAGRSVDCEGRRHCTSSLNQACHRTSMRTSHLTSLSLTLICTRRGLEQPNESYF